MLDALSPLGTPGNGVADAKGAIYLWAKLPKGEKLLQLQQRPMLLLIISCMSCRLHPMAVSCA